ncbi:MAG: FAD-dependent oxidoreductase, partial [Betaproteobacteria bacterium]
FLRECLPARTRYNTVQCLNLAVYSRDCLRALREETGIAYDGLTRGILQFFTDPDDFAHGVETADLLRTYGCDLVVKSVDECVAIEPALAQCRTRLAGGIYAASDESGDAQAFTVALARLAAARGVTFLWNTEVQALLRTGDAVGGVHVVREGSRFDNVAADAYVVALGSDSPFVLAGLGVPCNVYPAKGYSATIDIGGHRGAPTVSLTDSARKIVITRLGDRVRVAGTAELNGWDRSLDRTRCEALVTRTFDLFPDAGERGSVRFWTGLRPATPSNRPLLGRTRYRNLFVNTGHGTLGWTMACGSARALVDIVAARSPDVDFAFVDPARTA